MTATTIYVAEPGADIRDIYQFQFRKVGFKLEAVDTGEALIEKVKQSKPDLVITAITLGGAMDGYQVVRQLREAAVQDSQHIPVIVVSSRAQAQDIDRAYEVGADFYFVKPVEIGRLVRLVQSLLKPGAAATPGANT